LIQMYAKRMSVQNIAVGNDLVMFGFSLPSETVIHSLSMKWTMEGAATVPMNRACLYAVEGWILPVTDPDSAISHNVLWDNLVPKDTDVDTLDLDTAALDATPFFEPGEADLSQLFRVGVRPERVYHRHRMLMFGNRPVGHSITSEDVVSWRPVDSWSLKLSKRYFIEQPSVLLFAVASPSLDDTTQEGQNALAENEWNQLKYIGYALERAMMEVFGLTEAGATTPYTQATDLLRTHLEPDPLISDAAWSAIAWQSGVEAVLHHSVVGEIGDVAITTGR